MNFKQFYLTESLQISLSKKAWEALSKKAKHAIESWEAAMWIGGPLEKHIKANDDVAKEIRTAMEPILDSIKGDTITLYRGTSTETLGESRFLQSWSSSEKVAKHFAGLSRSQVKDEPNVYKTYTDKEIQDAVDTFNKNGFVKFDNRYYMVDKQNPKYYNIYDRNRKFITDGDDLKDHLITINDEIKKLNASRTKDKVVLKKTFDKNKIIWITNNLNSKEYIMRVDSE